MTEAAMLVEEGICLALDQLLELGLILPFKHLDPDHPYKDFDVPLACCPFVMRINGTSSTQAATRHIRHHPGRYLRQVVINPANEEMIFLLKSRPRRALQDSFRLLYRAIRRHRINSHGSP